MRNLNLNLKNIIIILFACLLISVVFAAGFENVQERELARKVLKSLQEGDLETFTTYCINKERAAEMRAQIGDETHEQTEMKNELNDELVTQFRNNAINGFNEAIEKSIKDTFKLKECEYPELAFYKPVMRVNDDVKLVKVKARLSANKVYMMDINMFKTKDDIFIYGFSLDKGGVY